MKPLVLLAAAALALSPANVRADDLTPPVLVNAVADVSVSVGAAPTVIKLKKTFGLQGVTGTVVRFTNSIGKLDVELFDAQTPNTVANFLSYVAKGDASTGGYNDTIIHRSIPGFIIQGGGYFLSGTTLDRIAAGSPVASEAGILNTTGTIAMALSNGPDSATTDWFFNVADNTGLDDASDGGPFTVFGRVITSGMDTLNAILALPTVDLSGSFGGGFENVPLENYTSGSGIQADNLVYTQSIAVIPLTAKASGGDALLKLKIVSNSNPDVVTATLKGHKLTLSYPGKVAGSAVITLQAKDSAKQKVRTSFSVTVQ